MSNGRNTGRKIDSRKNLMLFSGRGYPELAEEVAEHLGVEHRPDPALRLRER